MHDGKNYRRVLVRTPDESQDDVIGIVSGPPPEINELAKSMN